MNEDAVEKKFVPKISETYEKQFFNSRYGLVMTIITFYDIILFIHHASEDEIVSMII